MKVVTVSNFLSPHQQPLSEAIALQKDVEYRFIETEVIPAERVRLGYQYERPDYTLQAYEKMERLDICNNWVVPADVVIAGSSPEELFRKRIYSKRLTFRYSERPLKRGTEYLKFFVSASSASLLINQSSEIISARLQGPSQNKSG